MGIVLQWWLIFLLMGLGFLPLTTYVFRGFDDGGTARALLCFSRARS